MKDLTYNKNSLRETAIYFNRKRNNSSKNVPSLYRSKILLPLTIGVFFVVFLQPSMATPDIFSMQQELMSTAAGNVFVNAYGNEEDENNSEDVSGENGEGDNDVSSEEKAAHDSHDYDNDDRNGDDNTLKEGFDNSARTEPDDINDIGSQAPEEKQFVDSIMGPITSMPSGSSVREGMSEEEPGNVDEVYFCHNCGETDSTAAAETMDNDDWSQYQHCIGCRWLDPNGLDLGKEDSIDETEQLYNDEHLAEGSSDDSGSIAFMFSPTGNPIEERAPYKVQGASTFVPGGQGAQGWMPMEGPGWMPNGASEADENNPGQSGQVAEIPVPQPPVPSPPCETCVKDFAVGH